MTLDGVSILLDGLCSRIEPYIETPAHIAETIIKDPPDLLVFTHGHPDHFGEALVSEFQKQNLWPILGPESLPYGTDHRTIRIGNVTVTPIPSRHIGKFDVTHFSYLIEGSKRIFFAGDAAPLQWKGREVKLDVLIAPYAYANTEPTWAWSRSVADKVVLLHLPQKDNDPAGLWQQISRADDALVPAVGEKITL